MTEAAAPKRTTSRDVAKRAGVSQSTVSRALRGDLSVAEETRARIRAAATELGYTVAATSGSRTIGIVVSDIKNPFYPELIDVIQAELGFLGFGSVFYNERVITGMPTNALEQIDLEAVGGIILTSATVQTSVPLSMIERRLPIVLVNRLTEAAELDFVTADNVAGGRLAAEHLMHLGHQRLGLLRGPEMISTHRDRAGGFLRAVAERGLPAPQEPSDTRWTYSHETGYQDCLELLGRPDAPTAIFCTNDLMAFGALSAARSLGLRIPGDLSIMGFDDLEMSAWELVKLTTVSNPFRSIAKIGAQLMAERMRAVPTGRLQRHKVPVQVISRGTTAPPGGLRLRPAD